MLMQEEREQIVEYGKMASASGLCPGTSGNMSICNAERDLIAISPSGMDYFDIRPEDVVITDRGGHVVDGSRRPSSEWALHAVFYRDRPECRAVVHTHSVYCTTFAALGEPIRAVHYVLCDAGTDLVPCAPYRTFGTEELAEAAIAACGKSHAVLLANHGMVAWGGSLAEAYGAARNVEYVAQIQYRAACIGKPNVLTAEQMDAVFERARSYGQPK